MPQQTPNVFTYPRMEPGTLGHQDLVEPLRALPRQVADEIGALNETQLTWASDGAWSIKQHLGHLADFSEIDHKRIYMMSTQTDPILESYDQDALVTEHDYQGRPLEELLDQLSHWRGETVQLLTTLVNWNWARTGRHADTGRVSIRQLVEHMVEQEAGHLKTIKQLRERVPAPY
jgi:hypothetical protein